MCQVFYGKGSGYRGKETLKIMREYELTFIAKPDLDATNMAALLEKVTALFTTEGGKVNKLDRWGLRQLTYPIKKYREGQYVHMAVSLEAASVARIEQRLRLQEDLIRYLLVAAEENGTPDVMGGAEVAEAAEPAPVSETAS
jgi:small subunit ribosomal protein S6